jgi:hypothetical protein
MGAHKYETPLWIDSNVEQMASVKPNVYQQITIDAVQADEEGYVDSYLVHPSFVYGASSGRLVDEGLANRLSTPVGMLIKLGIQRRQAGIVGQGKNVWPTVSIADSRPLFSIF